MVRAKASLKGLSEFGKLLAKLSSGQIRQHLRIGVAPQQRFQHLSSRHPHHIAGHRGELEVGRLQKLVQSVHFPHPLVAKRFAIAGQIPKLPDRLGRNETPLQKPMGKEIGNPLAIRHIRLAPGHPLDVRGVDQQHREAIFQQIIDRLPKYPRALHRYVGHLFAPEPVVKHQKIRRHGTKRLNLLVDLPPLIPHPQTNHHRRLMDVQTTTPLKHHLHSCLLSGHLQETSWRQRVSLACSPNRGGNNSRYLGTSGSNFARALGHQARSRPHTMEIT
jgi:hypothetical protein